MQVSKKEMIAQSKMGRPHVVILGTGASRATLPDGDKNGRKVPLMNDFVEVLNLSEILNKTNIDFEKMNFEDIYDQIYSDIKYSTIRQEIEVVIYDYFSSLELPDTPTIYDHLILSLREKDVIATFNWDPLLTQAYRRNAKKVKLPRFLFHNSTVVQQS